MKKRGRLLCIAILLLGLISPALCVEEEKQPLPNVLLITIDTLRADHISSYGYSRETSPVIDRLAEEGTRFLSAYATVPFTGPSHASMMTSLPPNLHGALVNGIPIYDEVPTFAEVLQENGFSTVAVVSAWPLKNESCGLKRGFLHYDEKFQNAYGVWHTQQFGDVTADKAIAWLKGNYAGRFFLWVHFFDPHQPYRLNPGFTEFKELKKEGLDGLYKTKPRWKPVIDSYDSEVKFVDFQVGRIIQALERLNLLEKTLVILTSDHGESLGENDYNGHGRFLYESSVRVPLVIRFPGKEHSGRSVKREVSIMDVMPTVLDFLGIPPVQVPVGNTGVSLIPLLKGGEDSMVPGRVVEFEVYRGKVGRFPRLLSRFWYQRSDAELPRRLGMRRNGWKLIYTPGKKTEIFYLPDDPAECANLYKSNEALATGMREELVAMFSESSGSERSKEVKKMKMDRETREKLKSLGYTR